LTVRHISVLLLLLLLLLFSIVIASQNRMPNSFLRDTHTAQHSRRHAHILRV
jgi:hypothetical protein